MDRARLDQIATQYADHRLSRRLALLRGGAGLAAAGLAAAGIRSAFAQDSTPSAADLPRLGHPIVGAWHLDNSAADPGVYVATVVFDADGTYVEYMAGLGLGLGAWRATGERTADLIVVYRDTVSLDSLFDLAAPIPADVFGSELTRMQVSIELDESVNALTAAGFFLAKNGIALDDYPPYAATAIRLSLDAATA